jgi:MoaA/NifB/PqqE/SkfB family radical SAM enzyme
MIPKSKTFCMHPFTGLATREDGGIKPCCRSWNIGNVKEQSLEEIWNNDNMKRLRKQVLNDERPPECISCFTLEDQNIESLRQRHLKGQIPEARINLYPNAWTKMREDYSMPFEFPTMELKLNNLCNLKCRMCHPMDSTSWDDWDEIEEFYVKEQSFMVQPIKEIKASGTPYLDAFSDDPVWWENFERLIPYFRRLEFAGGEPLTDPTHYRILEMLQPYAHQIEIKYATNLTSLGKGKRNVFAYWPAFKSIAVNVSIDGLGDSYEYIRGNAKWDELVENIKKIQTIPNVSRIVGAVAVQVSNVLILDKMMEYFLDELGIVFYTNLVNYPSVLNIQVLPVKLKRMAIERLQVAIGKVPNYRLVKEHPELKDITIGQIHSVINYFKPNINVNLWKDCVEFNRRLDRTRKQSFTDNTPEFKPYVMSKVSSLNSIEANAIKIEWNLGKRCNYDCSYCPSEIHDNSSPHTDIELLKRTVDQMVKLDKPIRLSFTGGEPCVHPKFKELVAYCKAKGVTWISVTTNGTLPADFYSALPVDQIIFSLHFEFDYFRVFETIKKVNKTFDKEILVHVMAIHSHLNLVRNVVWLLGLEGIPYILRRIRWTDGDHDLFDDMKYEPNDLAWIKSSEATVNPNTLIDDTIQYHANDIIKLHLNQFKDWKCNIGIESLMVNWDGEVFRATCRVGGSLGNIYQGTFSIPKDPVSCTRNFCTCATDIPITKINSNL